jgi:hypothetical protein
LHLSLFANKIISTAGKSKIPMLPEFYFVIAAVWRLQSQPKNAYYKLVRRIEI